MSLAAALDDLKAALVAGEEIEAAVGDIADEQGVNPKLLRRKFEESFGALDQYAARDAAAREGQARMADEQRQREAEAEAAARVQAAIERRLGEARARRAADDPFGEKALDRALRRLARDIERDDPAFGALLADFLNQPERKGAKQ